ncbi:MAG: hypothetical protein A2202_03755 [Bdellovibrionales bacterium RIFOXYA1_FULL_36_14]|nr:MAG: hypothetical protein A2202_03755 [Bdellovibrionales bacterium RIFOXYA1_FULL_36_14]
MKNFRLNEGFTLVELMVVVAIIGILSAVAIPNFKKYQAKSKTSEAKLHLSAIYTAEQAFASDYDTYATCLSQMGYNPSTEAAQRYYATGFTAGTATAVTIAVGNGAACGAYVSGNDTANFGALKKIGATTAATSANLVTAQAGMTASESSFTAAALGYIVANYILPTTGDAWTITASKALTHTQVGY